MGGSLWWVKGNQGKPQGNQKVNTKRHRGFGIAVSLWRILFAVSKCCFGWHLFVGLSFPGKPTANQSCFETHPHRVNMRGACTHRNSQVEVGCGSWMDLVFGERLVRRRGTVITLRMRRSLVSNRFNPHDGVRACKHGKCVVARATLSTAGCFPSFCLSGLVACVRFLPLICGWQAFSLFRWRICRIFTSPLLTLWFSLFKALL